VTEDKTKNATLKAQSTSGPRDEQDKAIETKSSTQLIPRGESEALLGSGAPRRERRRDG